LDTKRGHWIEFYNTTYSPYVTKRELKIKSPTLSVVVYSFWQRWQL